MVIREYIDKAKTIGVISHINPDADNLGSLTALANSLRLYGKDVKSIAIDPIPYNLKFLYGTENITERWDGKYDLLFILDCSSVDRLGKAKDILQTAKKIVNIDHHISNNLKADFSFVDSTASSTGEVLYKLLKKTGLPIDNNVADSILTAISGDTGSFRYDSVTSETFETAAELLRLGANQKKVNINLYSMNPITKVKMLGRAISRMKIINNGSIGYTYVLNDDFNEFNAKNADIEGIVEYIRDIDGIEIAIFFRQNPFGFKVSTRSKKEYDVSQLALKYGGGGHIRAAGFTVQNDNIEEVIEDVLNTL